MGIAYRRLYITLIAVVLASCWDKSYSKNTEILRAEGAEQGAFEQLATEIVEYLCQDDGPYLSCLGISSRDCKSDMAEIMLVCSDKLKGAMPIVETHADLEKIGEFGGQVSQCLLKNHRNIGGKYGEQANKCFQELLE